MLPNHFLAVTKQATRTNMSNTTEVTLQAVRKCKIIKITENTNKKKQTNKPKILQRLQAVKTKDKNNKQTKTENEKKKSKFQLPKV